MSLTLLSLEGDYSSTCGYCGPTPGTRSSSQSSHSYGAYPIYNGIPCAIYMAMIDRGWRRSGGFLYKPSMEMTCCPQYTIRLNALEFAPSRSQRQVTNRWNRFILEDGQKGDQMEVEGGMRRKNKGKAKTKVPDFDLVTVIHSAETLLSHGTSRPAHRFEVTLEPSCFTQEKFQLYQGYQHDIHKEPKDKATASGFRRFLVDSPLLEESILYPTPPPSHLPKKYGAYHQCYRVDGELIAMAVLDILPDCVSSVYFMYDSRWERFSLGKVSALREATLAREIHEAGVSSMKYLYMGFYVHSCPKMRYKGDYAPSFLLDPEEYTWFPFKECMHLLDRHRYACFSHPENSRDEPPGSTEVLNDLPLEVLAEINILESVDMTTRTANIVPLASSTRCQVQETWELVLRGVTLLGPEIVKETTLCIGKEQ